MKRLLTFTTTVAICFKKAYSVESTIFRHNPLFHSIYSTEFVKKSKIVSKSFSLYSKCKINLIWHHSFRPNE